MKRILFLAAILVAMSVAGCGGATPTPTPTATPPPPTPTPTLEPTPTATPITIPGIVEALTPSTVLIYAEYPDAAYTGTGVIYDESGLAITNAHVVEGAAIVKAYIQGVNRWLSAQIVGVSTCEDLAVIDISGDGYVAAMLGESDEMKLGEEVIALGYPLASELGADLTINRGVVSKIHAQWDEFAELEDLVQTDTDINPGNSGGPLVNMRGEVIGINTLGMDYTRSGRPVSGLNFAIASSHAKPIIERLASGENVHWLGANAITNDADVAWYFELPVEEGLFVYAVSDNSPADQAGMEAGDVLVTMKGISLYTMADVCDILKTNPAGNPVAVEVMRGTKVLAGEVWGEKLSVISEVGPVIGLFTFAQAVDESDNCINPANSFPAGTPRVYTCWQYSGMEDKAVRMVWRMGGQTINEETGTWTQAEGNGWWYWEPEGEYTPGTYEVQLYVEGQLAQSDTFTVTAAAVGPTISPFAFAVAVDENDNCANPTTTFSSGTPQIYTCFDYSGMQDGMVQQMVWLRDGEIVKEVRETWAGGEEGNWWWRWGPEGGYTPGSYEAQFYVEGQLAQSGTFTVTGVEVSPTPQPSPQVSPAPEAPGLIDTFDDNRNGWFESEEDEAGNVIAIADGAYHIVSIYEEGMDNFLWGTSGVGPFANFDLDVDATHVEGTDNNEIAVVFGVQDVSNFYEFAISGDGYLFLGRYVEGAWEWIEEPAPSGAITQGNATNHIRLIVENGDLTAYVNDQLVLTSFVGEYQSGLIGFGCGPWEEPGAHCAFDNLDLTALP